MQVALLPELISKQALNTPSLRVRQRCHTGPRRRSSSATHLALRVRQQLDSAIHTQRIPHAHQTTQSTNPGQPTRLKVALGRLARLQVPQQLHDVLPDLQVAGRPHRLAQHGLALQAWECRRGRRRRCYRGTACCLSPSPGSPAGSHSIAWPYTRSVADWLRGCWLGAPFSAARPATVLAALAAPAGMCGSWPAPRPHLERHNDASVGRVGDQQAQRVQTRAQRSVVVLVVPQVPQQRANGSGAAAQWKSERRDK